jgi:hypothetical protein
MQYKATGQIINIPASEEISDGKYRKQLFVIKNNDGYQGKEKELAFEIFEKSDGSRIENFGKYNKVGDTVTVTFDVDCRESSGRYYTSLKAFRIDKAQGQSDNNVIEEPSQPQQTDELLEEEPPF